MHEGNVEEFDVAATVSKQTISAEGAQQVLDAAVAKANEIGVPMSITVLDEAANPVAFLLMDAAVIPSGNISNDKAWTATGFGLPTDQWYDYIKDDPALLNGILAIPRFFMIGGGYPLIVDGNKIGGIGVSGGDYKQDMEVAEAGVQAIA